MTPPEIDHEYSWIDALPTTDNMIAALNRMTVDRACLVIGYGLCKELRKETAGTGWYSCLESLTERIRAMKESALAKFHREREAKLRGG